MQTILEKTSIEVLRWKCTRCGCTDALIVPLGMDACPYNSLCTYVISDSIEVACGCNVLADVACPEASRTSSLPTRSLKREDPSIHALCHLRPFKTDSNHGFATTRQQQGHNRDMHRAACVSSYH